jgi:hypothetical protein
MIQVQPTMPYFQLQKEYKGQAMIEVVLILSFVVIALFWGMKYIAMLGDLQFKAHLSSRYVAWEKTVHKNKSDLIIQNEVSKRILARKERPIDSRQDALPVRSLESIELDPLLYLKSKTKGYQRQVLWSEKSDTHHPRIETKHIKSSGFSAAVDQQVSKFFRFNPVSAMSSELTFIARYHPELNLPHAGFALRSKNVMDYEAWHAMGANDVKSKVKKTLIGNQIQKTANFMLQPFSLLFGSRIELGIILPDYVSCDALKNSEKNKVKKQCH